MGLRTMHPQRRVAQERYNFALTRYARKRPHRGMLSSKYCIEMKEEEEDMMAMIHFGAGRHSAKPHSSDIVVVD